MKRTFSRLILLLTPVLLLPMTVSAQVPEIAWTPSMPAEQVLENFCGIDSTVAVRSAIWSKTTIELIKPEIVNNKLGITPAYFSKERNSSNIPMKFFRSGNTIYKLSYPFKGSNPGCRIERLDTSFQPDSLLTMPFYSQNQKQNGKLYAFYRIRPAEKKTAAMLDVAVYDLESFRLLYQTETPVPDGQGNRVLMSLLLSDDATVTALWCTFGSTSDKKEEVAVTSEMILKTITAQDISEFRYDLGSSFIVEGALDKLNEKLFFVGILHNTARGSAPKTFVTLQIDPVQQTVTEVSGVDCDVSFMVSGFAETDTRQLTEQYSAPQGIPVTGSASTMYQGSCYRMDLSSKDRIYLFDNGRDRYSRDILLCRVTPEGELLWTNRMVIASSMARQSISGYITPQDEVQLLFNEAEKQYYEDGERLPDRISDEPESFYKQYVVMAAINPATGKVKRTVRTDCSNEIVTSVCQMNKNELFIQKQTSGHPEEHYGLLRANGIKIMKAL